MTHKHKTLNKLNDIAIKHLEELAKETLCAHELSAIIGLIQLHFQRSLALETTMHINQDKISAIKTMARHMKEQPTSGVS